MCGRVTFLYWYKEIVKYYSKSIYSNSGASTQFFYTCCDVHLLRTCWTWTSYAEIFVVEEISNLDATCKFLRLKQFICTPIVYSLSLSCWFPLWNISTIDWMSFQAQFVTAMFWAAQSLYIGCKFTRWMQYNLIFYGGTILALFLNFYYHAYIKTIKKQVSAKTV